MIGRCVAISGHSGRPWVYSFEPSVTQAGIEKLSIVFPNTRYRGHFNEVGYNGIAIDGAAHCWVRDVRIHNADNGIFVSSNFCTLTNITLTSERVRNRHMTGHHGISFGGDDNLLTGFDIQTRFVHDITVSNCAAGNVIADGKGIDLSLDHHRRAPYANLFTNLDMGEGTRPWESGGGPGLGKSTAAWATFWNLRASKTMPGPMDNFGPGMINLVGVQINDEPNTDEEGRWIEHGSAEGVYPLNLYQAQLNRR